MAEQAKPGVPCLSVCVCTCASAFVSASVSASVCSCACVYVCTRASPSFYVRFSPSILTCLFIQRTHEFTTCRENTASVVNDNECMQMLKAACALVSVICSIGALGMSKARARLECVHTCSLNCNHTWSLSGRCYYLHWGNSPISASASAGTFADSVSHTTPILILHTHTHTHTWPLLSRCHISM